MILLFALLVAIGTSIGMPSGVAAGPLFQNAGLPPDSLPPAIRRIRRMDSFQNIVEFDRAATALHDSIRARGDTLSFAYACALDALVEASNVMERHLAPEVLHLAYRAVELKRATIHPRHPEVARSLIGLSQVEGWGFDRYERADSILREAEAINRAWYGPEHRSVGQVLRQRADIRFAVDDHLGSRRLAEEALSIFEAEASPDTSLILATMIGLGNIFAAQGRNESDVAVKARGLVMQARFRPRNRRVHMIQRQYLGAALLDAGRPAEARPHLVEAVAYFDSLWGSNHLNTRMGRGVLGTAQFLLGDDRAARESFVAATTVVGVEDPDHTVFWTPLMWLGVLDLASGDAVRARPSLERAAHICRTRYGPDHSNLAMTLETLVYCLQALGEADSARVLLREAQAIQQASRLRNGWQGFDPGGMTLAEGILQLDRGDTTQAVRTFERLLRPGNENSIQSRRSAGSARLTIARILAARGAGSDAMLQALDFERSARADVQAAAGVLPERQALQLAAVRERGIDLALEIQSTQEATSDEIRSRCFDELIRSRALVLDVMADRRGRLFRGIAGPRGMVPATWAAKGSQPVARAHRSVGGGEASVGVARILSLHEAIEIAEARAIDGVQLLGESRSESLGAGLEAVRKSLPARSALVSFWRREIPGPRLSHWSRPAVPIGARYDALVLPPGSAAPIIVALGVAEDVDRRVVEWIEGCASGAGAPSDVRCVEAGLALREILLDPLRSLLAEADLVFVVPDGAISRVHLAALPQANGDFMIEAGPVFQILACERDLVGERRHESNNRRPLLAIGGVDYTAKPDESGKIDAFAFALSEEDSGVGEEPVYRGVAAWCGDDAARLYAPLPGTRAEVLDLEIMQNVQPGMRRILGVTGKHATETRLKSLASRAGALHLATHGFYFDPACSGAGGASARLHGWAPAAELPLIDNPLTRCGLALAGANRRAEAGPDEDDGLLTGDEIAALDLSGVEFVVLSACNTGLGDVLDGEGVLGLQRAFKIAGAGPVVMSLWPVEDRIARQWMRHFYAERLSPGVTTAEATRRASLAMLAERRRLGLSTRPSSWAPFVSVGVER